MTRKTRLFVLSAVAVLVVGLGGALVAYLTYHRVAGVPPGLPPETRYVPADAAVVAFADVRGIMSSELRRSLVPNLNPESRKGRRMMNDFAGVDLEKQVNHVVAYVEASTPPDPQSQANPEIPRAVVLVQGTFDPARLEAFVRERAGTVDEYKGRKIFVHRDDDHEVAFALVGPDLIAMGQADLVRGVIDRSQDASLLAKNITTNTEMMNLIRDGAGSTAWVVGQFDEIRRRMRLPGGVASQVPPIRLVSLKAAVNGGVKATIRAEAADGAAADQLRDVVRGFISLGRLQAGARPDLEAMLKSIELSGTDATVRLSIVVPPGALRAMAPPNRRRDGAASPQDPSSPREPANREPGTPGP